MAVKCFLLDAHFRSTALIMRRREPRRRFCQLYCLVNSSPVQGTLSHEQYLIYTQTQQAGHHRFQPGGLLRTPMVDIVVQQLRFSAPRHRSSRYTAPCPRPPARTGRDTLQAAVRPRAPGAPSATAPPSAASRASRGASQARRDRMAPQIIHRCHALAALALQFKENTQQPAVAAGSRSRFLSASTTLCPPGQGLPTARCGGP